MDAENLFRAEAVANRTMFLFGGLRVPTGRTGALLTVGAVVLSVALMLMLVLGTYSRKERALGYLAPAAGVVRVIAHRFGVISTVNVGEGQLVEAGEPLLSISLPRDSMSGVDIDQARVDRLREEREAIRSQLMSERALAAERGSAVRRKIADLESQYVTVRAQQGSADTRVALLRRDTSRLEALSQAGHVPESLLDARRVQMLESQEDTRVLQREAVRIEGEMAILRSELVQLPLVLDVRLYEIQSRLASVDRMLVNAEEQQGIVVRAPIRGRIAGLVSHAGMTVSAREVLLSIIPEGSTLRAELLLPTRAVGFVKIGQEVRLRYDAFPYQKFGMHRGVIASISRVVLNPEDQTGAVRLQVPVYRVVANIDSQVVAAYGEEFALQPGLTLSADIIRDRRRIIEWIFDPVIAAARGI